MLASAETYEIFFARTGDFLFALMDRDGDGDVDFGDHRDFLRTLRVEPGPWADDAFDRADRDRDRKLYHAEVARVIREL